MYNVWRRWSIPRTGSFDAFWSPFGSLLVPFGFQLIPFASLLAIFYVFPYLQHLPKTTEFKQDQTKINQTIAKHKPPNATCRNASRKRRAQKLRGRRCNAAWRLQSALGLKAPQGVLAFALHLTWSSIRRLHPVGISLISSCPGVVRRDPASPQSLSFKASTIFPQLYLLQM